MNYKPIIGLEVHVELKTNSKMFCGCTAFYFGEKPNTHTCPVCLGLPGALPIPNKKAIEWCVMIAQSLNCKINKVSKFDRKNYFYPDLAKGYQISQYDQPFGEKGSITVQKDKDSKETKTIGITRVHMEEDTGKLTHTTIDGKKVSLVDFNRSGVPLVEIVTEPDFDNEFQVIQYLQKLQKIVRYLDVSNADMEKGEMRLEPNISLAEIGFGELPKYKVEVKNINSFSFVGKAIKFEIKRQAKILDDGQTPIQETRGWNETKNETVSQRSKEEAHDYRYFPEPDIPPILFTDEQIQALADKIGELPGEKMERFQKEFGLSPYDAEIVTREKNMADYFEEAVKVGKAHNVSAKQIANLIINRKIDTDNILPARLIEMVLAENKKEEISPELLENAVKKVLNENSKAVEEYKSGKENVFQFLLGQVMRELKMKVDIKTVIDKIKELI